MEKYGESVLFCGSVSFNSVVSQLCFWYFGKFGQNCCLDYCRLENRKRCYTHNVDVYLSHILVFKPLIFKTCNKYSILTLRFHKNRLPNFLSVSTCAQFKMYQHLTKITEAHLHLISEVKGLTIGPGIIITKGLSQVLDLNLYVNIKPETLLRPFINTAPGLVWECYRL